jgi:hypothetical protein
MFGMICNAMELQSLDAVKSLKQIVMDYLVNNSRVLKRPEFRGMMHPVVYPPLGEVIHRVCGKKLCLQKIVINYLLKKPKLLKKEEFQRLSKENPIREKIVTVLKKRISHCQLIEITKYIDCPLLSVQDLVYSVIFSHMYLPTYQKKTMLDLFVDTRDDAKKTYSGECFNCLQWYLSWFPENWLCHWPSQRVVRRKDGPISLLGLTVENNWKQPLEFILSMHIMDHHDLHKAACVAMKKNNKEFFDLLYQASKKTEGGALNIVILLIEAIESECTGFIHSLLNYDEQKVQVDSYYQRGKTPLLAAAESNSTFQTFATLLKHQAPVDVNHKDSQGQVPLHKVAQTGSLSIVKLLVNHGAIITAKDNNDFTVLHGAVQGRKYTIVEYLLQQGASKDINAKDKSDITPLELAKGFHWNDGIQLLKKYAKQKKEKNFVSFLKKKQG